MAPLLSRINYQHKEIDAQLRTLRQKTDEFTQITGSMQEGLVLLDEKGTVLSINHAACRLFQADNGCVGRDFLTVDRSHELCLAMETAREKGHSQLRCQRNGREYQLDMSRIQSDGETVGTVLLAFDVTEQEYAERNRREFTANVSHELKTPLQGIVGSAELIQSGMVKPEDMPRFVGHIHDEASRMVTLVEDIIRLSQLDEGDAMPTETVDLLALSQEAVANLQDAAAKQQVSLSVDGDHAPVIGVRRLLYEVIFNLCDNAIKYNVPDGTVKVQVSSENGISSVTVSDTGIGIAPEHQSRVFERFYRVDKSHSKASGGTGLGLSIVKHAVQYHHGDIRLTSKPGEGTVIRITFPAAPSDPLTQPIKSKKKCAASAPAERQQRKVLWKKPHSVLQEADSLPPSLRCSSLWAAPFVSAPFHLTGSDPHRAGHRPVRAGAWAAGWAGIRGRGASVGGCRPLSGGRSGRGHCDGAEQGHCLRRSGGPVLPVAAPTVSETFHSAVGSGRPTGQYGG